MSCAACDLDQCSQNDYLKVTFSQVKSTLLSNMLYALDVQHDISVLSDTQCSKKYQLSQIK